MVYEILMPQLSDSMDEGKLVSWKVKVNDRVQKGEVIAEVESDKAIMEVQCFKNGVVEALNIKEGESASVGTVIAIIQTEGTKGTVSAIKQEEKKDVQKEPQLPKETIPVEEVKVSQEKKRRAPRTERLLENGDASPKAKALAAHYGLDIKRLQEEMHLPLPAHENDIKKYRQRRFFTPKALHVIEQYSLSTDLFDLSRKHDTQDVLEYVRRYDLPLSREIDSFQKALIKRVENALQKPVYRIYDHIDSALLEANSQYSMTAWLIKLFATAMMEFDGFRSKISAESIQLWPNASISVAMAKGKLLYMPVFKVANDLSVQKIQQKLSEYQQNVKEENLSIEQIQGSTFGISNLGMTGIERFDAIINQDDSAIAAIGSSMDGKIAVTLSIDHRLVNGYEAALFMQRVKSLSRSTDFFAGVRYV